MRAAHQSLVSMRLHRRQLFNHNQLTAQTAAGDAEKTASCAGAEGVPARVARCRLNRQSQCEMIPCVFKFGCAIHSNE